MQAYYVNNLSDHEFLLFAHEHLQLVSKRQYDSLLECQALGVEDVVYILAQPFKERPCKGPEYTAPPASSLHCHQTDQQFCNTDKLKLKSRLEVMFTVC